MHTSPKELICGMYPPHYKKVYFIVQYLTESDITIQIQIQILYSFHKSITEQEFMGCGDRQLRVMDWHTDNRQT
jgi:hypothetical protein